MAINVQKYAPNVPPATSRIEFRIWTSNDLGYANALWGDNKATEFIGGPFSDEKVRQRFNIELDELNKSGLQYWAMYFRSSGEFMGCCGIHLTHSIVPGDIEFGINLLPKFWGQGIAPEAASSVFHFAFDILKVPKILSCHHPRNYASKSYIIHHLKMTRTGEVFYPRLELMTPIYYVTNNEYCNQRAEILSANCVKSKL